MSYNPQSSILQLFKSGQKSSRISEIMHKIQSQKEKQSRYDNKEQDDSSKSTEDGDEDPTPKQPRSRSLYGARV